MRQLVMAAMIVGVAGVSEAVAQTPITFAVEGRGAFAVPTGDWTDEDGVENGYGFGANVQVGVGGFAIYGGWEDFIFGLDEEGLGEDTNANAHDTGFRIGLQASIPIAPAGPSLFAHAGAIYNKTSLRFGDDAGSLEYESDDALGWEAGAGVVVPLGATIAFTPAARYRTHEAQFDAFAGLGDNETTVGYFVVDVGIRFGIGR